MDAENVQKISNLELNTTRVLCDRLHAPAVYATLVCMPQASETLEQVFREEYGRIIATLIRISGSFDLAEESLQEAFASAAANWERAGTPRNPGAWLTTVAHRKLLDAVRR